MSVNIRTLDKITILEFEGSFDRMNCSNMRQAIMDATSGISPLVVVNLGQVHFMDSSGLSALVLGLKQARENQGNLCLCCLQSPVRMIFELTRFDKVFEIFIHEEDAVDAVMTADQ